jgi:hypothetical protein
MQPLLNASHVQTDNDDNVLYHFVGNFIPPEWRNLGKSHGKSCSKTAKQLLSLIVYRLQICDAGDKQRQELQESYYFFQQALGVCQRRVRQCFVELECKL